MRTRAVDEATTTSSWRRGETHTFVCGVTQVAEGPATPRSETWWNVVFGRIAPRGVVRFFASWKSAAVIVADSLRVGIAGACAGRPKTTMPVSGS